MDQHSLVNRLFVDLAVITGPVKYGASGFLYGMGKDGIPGVNTLAPLKPQVAAQKPEGGLQHPNGDALSVANTYQLAGGKEIEIYIQDMYPSWPYEALGLQDYLQKVEQVVSQVLASPHRRLFSYVPFNEPDAIWYNKTDKKQAFFQDWKTVYQTIKRIDPAARIVGPNLCAYDRSFYREFLAYAKQMDCLPDVVSWHELNDPFFSGWYSCYEDYRTIENELGIAQREICINEYCRINGDLGIPGKLIQWMTRFENSKVDACLAYWTDAGSLNNLVARDTDNQGTGAWWLYRWYGGLTGSTVQVTPPDLNAEGLQGIAALDAAKRQARILLGGCRGKVEVVVQGLNAAACFGSEVTAAVWCTPNTGLKPSHGPRLISEDHYPIENGQITIPLSEIDDTAAYQIIVTPRRTRSLPQSSFYYPAEFAEVGGGAVLAYSSDLGSAFIKNNPGSQTAISSFVVSVPDNGFYQIMLGYSAGPLPGQERIQKIRLLLNREQQAEIALLPTNDWETWTQCSTAGFLQAGINQITCESIPGQEYAAVHLQAIEITSTSGWIQSYEAEAVENTRAGTVAVMDDPAASGARFVGGIGKGPDNFLQFNTIVVPQAGQYVMVVTFANAESRGGHSYNNQIVDQHADIRVNSGDARRIYFRNTFGWDHYQTRVVYVSLQQGTNVIQFFNRDSDAEAPHIDKIEIAAI